MTRKIIPAPVNLPFSEAIIHNHEYTMEISGQIGLDRDGNLPEGIKSQTKETLKNVLIILQKVRWNLNNLTKVRILLTDINDYGIVNEIYSSHFEKDFPTRVAFAVKDLPLGALIEMDCTAAGDIIND